MGARLIAVLGMIGQHHGFNANAMNGKKIAPNGAAGGAPNGVSVDAVARARTFDGCTGILVVTSAAFLLPQSGRRFRHNARERYEDLFPAYQ
ncbi:MAG: hypothetical protein AAGH42_01065 [Pseudomonadota bacterium]